MSSSASRESQPVGSEPSPRGRPVAAWTWPAGARALLAGWVIMAALGLGIASWDVATPMESESIGAAPALVLDPNTAPQWALAALPHVGPVLADRIVRARSERPFSSLEEIRDRVRGVGPVTLARIAPYLRIEWKPGVSPENLASSHGPHSAVKPRASRRKVARAARPASTSRRPRPAARPPEPDTQLDLAIAHRE